ncbi:hypothetical protein QYF61_011626 [Mycteria americana]|uniref:Uncharacterized protein n=1 Tax=Mycteria americana TaxID=33587 RepID=A0AAN7SG42_MYCAM|nr:hypothetical protein QYF61_011626 [Mycteria americana]
MRSPLSLLFSKLDKPSVLSHSSEDMPSSPFTGFVALLWLLSRTFTSFLNGGAQNCSQYSRMITSFDRLDVVRPLGCQGTLLTPTDPAVDQHPQIPFCRASLQPLLSQFILVFTVQNPAFFLVKFHAVDDCPMLQSVEIPLQGLLTLKESTAPPSLVSSANLLMVHSTPASRSLINILNTTGPRIEA